MTPILGIDIAREKFDIVLLPEGHKSEQASFDNRKSGFQRLQRFLKKRHSQEAHACLEATGVYYEELAHFLHENGSSVSVINPLQSKAYAQAQLQRNKTDRLDAALIADYCRTQNPALWTPPKPAYYELRALVRHLEDLESDRQRQRNRLHALKHARHPSQTIIGNLMAQIDFLSQQIQQVKQQIHDHISQHPDLKKQRNLLASINGIGNLTAAKLLAEYGDMRQFEHVGQVVAFAGLNPKQRQSGSSIRGKTPISKIGRSTIRATLYMPAITAKRFNPVLQPLVQRLQAQGLSGMEIVVAVMRKLLHLAFGILKSGQPFDPNFLQKEAALA